MRVLRDKPDKLTPKFWSSISLSLARSRPHVESVLSESFSFPVLASEVSNQTRGKMSRLLHTNFGSVLLIAIASVLVFIRFLPTLPSVMQDEYVYLTQALLEPVAENDFGNFLHSLIYGLVGNAGAQFYTAVKFLNLVFLFIFGLSVFLTAKLYVSRGVATALGAGAVLSATGMYASIFTPEVMFFGIASLAIFFLCFSASEAGARRTTYLLLTVVLLGLAGLVKPHAFILVAGILVFLLLLIGARRLDLVAGLASFGSVALGYPMVKLGLGFLIAGENGLTLLGSSYESSLQNFFSKIFVFAQVSHSAAGAGGISPVSAGVSFTSVSSFTFVQFFVLLSALLFMTFGLPLFLFRPLGKLTDFQLFVLVVTAVYLLSIAGFSALVTFAGDDHSDRVLGRYFEFLVPFIILAGLVEVAKREVISTRRLVVLLVLSGSAGISWISLLNNKDFKLADSGILLGAFRESWLPWLVLLVSVGLIFLMRYRTKHLLTLSTMFLVGVTAIIGLSAQQRQIDLNSEQSPADIAGQDLEQNFQAIDGEDIVITGTNGPLAFVSKFWSMKADVDHLVFVPGATLSVSDPLFGSYDLIVELEDISFIDGVVLSEGDGYRILGKLRLP